MQTQPVFWTLLQRQEVLVCVLTSQLMDEWAFQWMLRSLDLEHHTFFLARNCGAGSQRQERFGRRYSRMHMRCKTSQSLLLMADFVPPICEELGFLPPKGTSMVSQRIIFLPLVPSRKLCWTLRPSSNVSRLLRWSMTCTDSSAGSAIER